MEEHEHMPAFSRESDEWLREHKDDSLYMNTQTPGQKQTKRPMVRRGKLPRSAVIYSE